MLIAEEDDDGTDYSNSWGDAELGGEDSFLSIETGGAGFQIVDIRVDLKAGELSFDFTSRSQGVYIVEATEDFHVWVELDDSVQSAGELTTFTDTDLDPALMQRYYRVWENF